MADPSKVRVYGVKIWQTNGVDGTYALARDLSPCQKDGKGALYDSVNDEVLFPGTGTPLLTSSSAVWNNTAGDNSFENPANWSTGVVPSDGDSVTVNVSGETTLIVTEAHALSGVAVSGNGTLRFVDNGSLSYMRLNIASGATVVRTGTAGLVDGGLSGTGSFVLDPGAGNTVTMTKNNLDFLGVTTTAASTREYDDVALVTTCNEGTIRIREGATWLLRNYRGAVKLSVKNLILEGSVTRDANDAANAADIPWKFIDETSGDIYTVKEIGKYAFRNFTKLTGTLAFPSSVTAIGERAFEGCSGLTGLKLGPNIATIGAWAFLYCPNMVGDISDLTSVTSFTGSNGPFDGADDNKGTRKLYGNVRFNPNLKKSKDHVTTIP